MISKSKCFQFLRRFIHPISLISFVWQISSSRSSGLLARSGVHWNRIFLAGPGSGQRSFSHISTRRVVSTKPSRVATKQLYRYGSEWGFHSYSPFLSRSAHRKARCRHVADQHPRGAHPPFCRFGWKTFDQQNHKNIFQIQFVLLQNGKNIIKLTIMYEVDESERRAAQRQEDKRRADAERIKCD